MIDEDGLHCGICGSGLDLSYRSKSGVRGIPVRFAVGDVLWVRETGCELDRDHRFVYGRREYAYAADMRPGSDSDGIRKEYGYKWKPSIHMPRWASRLTLKVTGVKVERLQDMEGQHPSDSDAIAEGVNAIHHGDGAYYYSAFRDHPDGQNYCDPADAFRELWDSINGAGSWDSNPWIVAVTFTVHQQNVDAFLGGKAAA